MAQDTPEKSILEKLAQTQTFHPAGAKLFVPDWALDPGDVVTVTSKKDVHDPDEEPTEYKVPIYSMDLTWNGTSRLDIQSTGNQEREPLSALRRKEYQTGRRGYGMAKELDDNFKEFETWQTQTDEVIGTYAAQFVDILGDGTNEGRLTLAETAIEQTASDATITAQAAGILLDEDGHPVLDERGKYQYDPNAANTTLTARINTNATNITTEVTRLDGEDSRLSGLIQTEAGKISQIVSAVGQNGEVTAGSIILAINKSKDGSATSTATITADAINLEGVVTAVFLDSRMANIENLFSKTGYSESITVQKSVNAGNVYTENLYIGDSLDNVQIHTYPIYLMGTGTTALDGITAAVVSQNSYMDLRHSHAITITPMSGDDEGKIQIQLGAAVTTDSSDRIKNFNIADTAFYKKRVGISSVDPGNWQYDSTEHKYYNPVVATAKDSTQTNPDTMTANVFIPDITLTPVINGLTYVGKVNAWGPSVSGTVYAAADELSLYLKEKDNYVYITKTDSDPVPVGPNSNVVARMEIQGGGSEEDYNQGYADGQTNARAEISGIILNRTYTSYSDNNLSIKISGTPKLVLLSNDDPPVETERTGQRLDVDTTMVVRTTNASLSEGAFTNGQYTITGTGGNVNVDSVDGTGGANIPVGVTPLTFTPTAAIEEGQKSVDPDFAVSGWRWDGPEGSETLGNLVVTENPYNTSLYHNVNVTLPYLSTSVTKTQVVVSARDQAMVSKVVATSNHTIDLDSIQESDIPTGRTASPLSEGCYVLNYKQGGNTTGWAYYKVSGGTVENGTISDIILQSENKVSYDSTRQYLKVNVQATGTNITNVPFNDSVDLAVTATEMVLQKSALTNKTTDPNNSQNTYAGQYRITRKSGGVFKAENVETIHSDAASLYFSLELNTPTSTLGGQGTSNWDDTEHKYKYKLYASLNVDNDGTVLRRETGELVLDPSQAIQYGKTLVTIDTITLGTITANSSTRRATVRTTVTLDNGASKTSDVDVSTIYQAGLDGGPEISRAPFIARLVDTDNVFIRNRQKTVNVSAIYQKGVDDASPSVTYVYVYASGNTGAVNMRSSPSGSTGNLIGRLYCNTKVTYISYSNGYAKVSYDGYTGYVSCSGGLDHNFVWTTPKSGVSVVTTGWSQAPGEGGDDPVPTGKTFDHYEATAAVHHTNVYSGRPTILVQMYDSSNHVSITSNPVQASSWSNYYSQADKNPKAIYDVYHTNYANDLPVIIQYRVWYRDNATSQLSYEVKYGYVVSEAF